MARDNGIASRPTREEINRTASRPRPEVFVTDNSEILREMSALMQQIEKGHPMHPREVQDMVDQLIAEGYPREADRLASMEANWDHS